MRLVSLVVLSMIATGACGGKKPAPADVAAPPEEVAAPAEDTAQPAPDAEKAPEDAAKAPEDAAAPAGDVAAAGDAGAAAAGDAGAAADAAAAAVDPEVIKRGEYVAAVAGCALCHTAMGPQGPMLDKMWAGGLEIPEAFGTWRSPNITQDKKTGIGGWSDAEIIAAVREGKRPDGSLLFPIMPYPFYNKMSDKDAKALVAYLRTIAAIDNAVAGNTDLKLPKMPMPAPTGAEPEAEPVKQGEYLATLMHCGACHTPMGPEGPDMGKWLAGSAEGMEIPFMGEGKLYMPNITPHPTTGIGAWTDAEIATAIKEAKRKDGTPIMGPMQMYVPAWSKISDADIAAIVAYLRSVPAVDNAIPKSTFKPHAPPPPGGEPGADAGAAPAPDAKP